MLQHVWDSSLWRKPVGCSNLVKICYPAVTASCALLHPQAGNTENTSSLKPRGGLGVWGFGLVWFFAGVS